MAEFNAMAIGHEAKSGPQLNPSKNGTVIPDLFGHAILRSTPTIDFPEISSFFLKTTRHLQPRESDRFQ